ncbi:hypothetical protein M1373_01900 [Candidatus Marsarchaeota archaeon]|nr:hypothetical protein [Candidatus Marsarchaeota archaeon]MCL5404346.1 hypothetical protein [Candidatus Marsarchaeota archaeon]
MAIQDFGKIAVVGEREMVLGFKLIGIKDVFISEGKEAAAKLSELMGLKEYDLIISSYDVRKSMGQQAVKLAETMLKPLVVFIPSENENAGSGESVGDIAKRVLGIDIYKNG